MALRIIDDREREINDFIPEEYWSLDATFRIPGEKRPLVARFYGSEKKKQVIHSEEELKQIVKDLEGAAFRVAEVKKGERTEKSAAAIYHQHIAAGSGEGAEFFNAENDAAGAAAVRRN